MRTPWQPDEPLPLPEYPRPQMARPGWVNLNGWWEYAIAKKEFEKPARWDGKIRVPFPVESLLSGVQKSLLPEERLWYRRDFELGHLEAGRRLLLHFGAVDYLSEVWINDRRIGEHRGGYLPFSFDITDFVRAGKNELVVAVWDPTDAGLQQRGKQVLTPKGIWYTAVSGIWQTVWIEEVPAVSIESVKVTPDLDNQRLSIEVKLRGGVEGHKYDMEAIASASGKKVASVRMRAGSTLTMLVSDPHLWTPQDPHLYDLVIYLYQDDVLIDTVQSYFAMRKFGLTDGPEGKRRFTLNGEELFLYGPLDQGYFPDGLYTAPSEAAMLFDIEYTKKIGCNMIRKHVKVEPQRWYYACDRLGMIVWQDMPNGGLIDGELIAGLTLTVGWHRNDRRRLARFGRGQEHDRAQFRHELQGMIDHLYNSACVAVWVPFNESWGQFHAREIAEWIRQYDPTRLVDHAAGWFDQGGGDLQSEHVYFRKLKRPRPDGRAYVLSEFGGYSLQVPGHLWDGDRKFGYRFFDSSAELTRGYVQLLETQLKPLIAQGLTAAVYTETTDVEIEVNGFLTYDRKVEKMDAGVLRKIHQDLTGCKG